MSEDVTEARPAWAQEIRTERERRFWTQAWLARELWYAADDHARKVLPARSSMVRQIREHERGANRPGSLYAELYRRVWAKFPPLEQPVQAEAEPDLEAELLGLGDPLAIAWTVGRLDQRVDRRTLLQLAAVTAAGNVAGAALDPAQRLMRALSGDHRPDGVTVNHLEDRTKGFHRLEEHYPARALYPALLTHLSEVSALLEAGQPEPLRERLAVAAGESAVLASWFAWELGDGPRAAAISRVANFAARHGSDDAIAACMAGYRTYMTGGDNSQGTRIAAAALERLGDADAATRAWLLARLGEEAALLGDRKTAIEAIKEGVDVYAGADITARPWTCFLDPGRYASMALSVFSRVGSEDDAASAIDEIVHHLGPGTETKKLCVVKADLALARYRLGDVTEAVTFARSALSATAAMSAPLGWERLDQVVIELEPSSDQAARDFRTEYAAVRPATVQPSLL